uniref:Uncharacterized protein n=1 Tax=Arundo donax TaxID=35708 RepID=A0A0A9ECJ7_ARUDO
MATDAEAEGAVTSGSD